MVLTAASAQNGQGWGWGDEVGLPRMIAANGCWWEQKHPREPTGKLEMLILCLFRSLSPTKRSRQISNYTVWRPHCPGSEAHSP